MAEFCDYALWKMAVRGIERDEVELVLADPDWDEPSSESPRHIYARRVAGRAVCVAVEPFDHRQVVTAFLPD
jgi:hypothetical protein